MKNNKTKIIVLGILLALAVSFFVTAIVLRNTRNTDTPDAETPTAAITPSLSGSTDDSGIGIVPMGWWEDMWKIPEEINVYGTVHAGDKNTTVSSGSYTNKAFGYTAPDGFPQYQMKSPNNSGFDVTVLGTHSMWSNTNTNGWYYFRGYKPSPKGDYTKESSICLDTVKPQIQARINGSSVANGTVTTSSSATISLLGSDDRSGVSTYWYTMNGYGGTYYQCYSSSSFASDGVYTFYCVDRAGNVSDTVTVTKDTTAPTVRAYNGTSQISNGAILYASSARFEASDSTTGVAGIYIKTPGSGSYLNYGTAATFTTEGAYSYYARDNAGNQSSTYSFTIDRTAPTAYLYSGTTSVSSGYYSAASYVRFTASDTNGYTCYYKKDSGSYGVYTSGTNLTAEGVYSFYAVDPAGNSTSTYTITLDRTAPVGTLYAGTTSVSSGKITNASYVTYTATDTYALNALYVYKPGTSSYVTFTSGTQFTADGWYYFYATDKSGNASTTVSVLLDRTKPTVTINAGGAAVSSGGDTNASVVTFSASDATSGVSAMYVRVAGSSSYISYVAGTPFSAEGTYYFYATDVAGNVSDTVNVTVDRTLPVGTLTANGATVTSGTFTNKAFYYTATDSLSGISKLEIRRPNGAWETYTSGASIAATSANGLYSFRATDRAGNVSAESQINLVTAAPTLTIYAGATVVPSGTFTNGSYVAFSASGASGSTATLYVKQPDSSSFTVYAANTQLSKEGLYSFYTTDNAGNTSATVTVTLDRTAPVGTLTANGATVVSGSYTNKAFSYSATDGVSGISKCEIKRPNGAWEAYTAGTSIAVTSANGLYSFRATDKAGNVSAESQITLVTAVPTVTIYAGTAIVTSGTYTNKSYVAFNATGTNGSTVSLFVKIPDSSNYTAYISGTPLYREGLYNFYAADNAGNTSATVNITLDVSNPIGAITAGGATIPSGNYVNTAFKYSATDSVSGIARYEILRPNGVWQTCGGEEITAGSGNGWYSFRAFDRAGNVSIESKVYLLTLAPSVQLYAEEQPIVNGTYTTAARISMSALGGTGLTCYVKLPNANGFTAYNQYFTYTAAGRYEFYAEDAAGNKSGVFAVIIDRTAKPISVVGVTNAVATGNVVLTWDDGDTNTNAPIVSVTINGVPYQKGNAVKTIDGGAYLIKTTDAAGNTWTTEFSAVRTDVISATLNKQYFEAKDGADNSYAFSTYNNALNFAKEREAALVRTGMWNGAVWDVGIAMDSADSVNAVNGIYYIYKKSGDKATEVAYFTLERLNAVITEYASETVKAYYYWQKVPADIYGDNDLYALKDSRIFIGDSVTLGSHANYLIDGVPFGGLTYSAHGIHTLTVFDDYGNLYEYILKITRQAPEINYMAEGGGVWNTATAERQYRLTKAVTVKITDNVDDFAMFYILNGSGEVIATLHLGDEYTISKSGRYTVRAVNHYGVSDEIIFVLSLSSPIAAFTDNGQTKRLELRIEPSLDTIASLTEIRIYKSIDGGSTWQLLINDDYGRVISTDKLFYEFNKDGVYKAIVEDNFRSGIDATTAVIDYLKPAPVGTLHGVTDGGYTNGTVRFTWDDEAYAYLTLNGDTAEYLSGTHITAEGEYVLEFRDANGYSRIITFTVDTTKPAGTISASGGYTNTDFNFTATDNLSGVSHYEIKRPNGVWQNYNGDGITADSGDGWYYFRAIDKAGNVSDEYGVCLITAPPVVTAYAEATAVNSGAYTNKNYIFFTSLGGSETVMYIKAPNASTFTIYVAGTQLSVEGTYYVYAVDLAGNIGETVSVTLDKGKPNGVLTTNGATAESGSYTNKVFSYSATDGISGVSKLEIKRPNGNWEAYNGEVIAVNGGDGWYSFRTIDKAGNVSDESRIYLLTAIPTVQLYVDEKPVANGTYTNGARISMSAGGVATTCYIRLPDAGGFTQYSPYFTFSTAGRYEFYTQDEAGNISGVYVIIIDRTAKPVTVNGLINDIASGDTAVTWNDGSLNTTAPIVSVTVNGVLYNKGDAIRTIDGGVYIIKTTDAAGNVWTTKFTAKRADVISQTLNKQYFETNDGSGKTYAFESYDNALTYAKAREAALVRTAVWNSATWDGGIPMDSIDSANAKNGTYYIYKKSGDKTTEVAYFTLERLNAVIAEYATESVKSFWWWEQAPSSPAPAQYLYGLTADRVFVGDSVTLGGHANYLIDGKPYAGLIFSEAGEHILTVYDDFGNSYEYTLIIVKTAPDILYKLNGGVWNLATDDKPYAFQEAVTLTIGDELSGEFAMFIIKNSAGEVLAVVGYGEEYTLNKSGRYTVYAINHGGQSTEISFILSLNSPVVNYVENETTKRLEIRIEPSADGAALTEIQIYKSVDGGLTWVRLEKDDYGRTVNANNLFYEFNRDGLYRVVATDSFRSGIDAVTAEKDYQKPAPVGTLHGVTDGGYINGTVRFNWTDDAKATVTFNGETKAYASGAVLSEDGEYTLTFADENGFEATYTFTIKTTAPAALLSGEPLNGYLTESVTITFEDGCTALLYLNGKFIGEFESGTELDLDGKYEIIVSDLAGNVTTVTFTLDTAPPTAELVNVTNGGSTSGTVIIRNLSEFATVKVYFNGSLTAYSLGENLTDLGAYRVVLTDEAGNITEYTFDIIYAVNTAGTIIIIIIVFGIIGGAVAVYLFRKRGKFKSNKTNKPKKAA